MATEIFYARRSPGAYYSCMDKERREYMHHMCLGLCAASFAGILGGLQIQQPGVAARVAFAFFAIAMPLTAMVGSIMHHGGGRWDESERWFVVKLETVGTIGSSFSVGGIACLLLHLGVIHFVAFLVVLGYVIWFCLKHHRPEGG